MGTVEDKDRFEQFITRSLRISKVSTCKSEINQPKVVGV